MKRIISFLIAKKWYFISLTLIGLAVVARYLLLNQSGNYLFYTVHTDALIDTVEVSSSYQTAMRKPILSTANGIIAESYVKNGDYIMEGEPLVFIESTATEAESAAVYSVYSNAVNKLNTAKQTKLTLQSQLEGARKAVLDAQAGIDDLDYHLAQGDDNSVTKRQYTQEEKDSKHSSLTLNRQHFDAVEQQYVDADQAISAAAADLHAAQLAYNATQSITIHAPTSGKVVNYLKIVGDEVLANQQPIMVLTSSSNPSITVAVNEIYMPRIKSGQKAEIIFDALADHTFQGVVEDYETVGVDNQGSVTYKVKISIQDISDEVLPEMTAIVKIETFRKDNVLAVPSASVVYEEGNYVVYRTQDFGKSYEKVAVTKGEVTTDKIEIVSGLNDGDVVITNADAI